MNVAGGTTACKSSRKISNHRSKSPTFQERIAFRVDGRISDDRLEPGFFSILRWRDQMKIFSQGTREYVMVSIPNRSTKTIGNSDVPRNSEPQLSDETDT
ncbi:hypothetical protein TNCV_1002331 [Trichonephila clavipes]|nr:hypothetical protein TNCV_1002331 [Trichonephila clavipes]